MKTLTDKISIKTDVDPYKEPDSIGDLTEKQYAALQKVAELSPGYHFMVVRYAGTSSKATHVEVYAQDPDDSNSEDGLVGKKCAQFYDGSKATEKVVLRVAHRVYHWCPRF